MRQTAKLSRKQRRRLKYLRKQRNKRLSNQSEGNHMALTDPRNGVKKVTYKEGTDTRGKPISLLSDGASAMPKPTPSYASQRTCYHAGMLTVVKLRNGALLHGAQDSLADTTYSTALAIRCNGTRHNYDSPRLRLPEGYEDLAAYEHVTPEIQIDWPDFQEPLLHPAFWLALYKKLPQGDILIYCQGGHGRTGTAIAALMIASGEYTSAQAIDHVRTAYCKKAIEACTQEKYLRDVETALTGKAAKDRPKSVRYLETNTGRKEYEVGFTSSSNTTASPDLEDAQRVSSEWCDFCYSASGELHDANCPSLKDRDYRDPQHLPGWAE